MDTHGLRKGFLLKQQYPRPGGLNNKHLLLTASQVGNPRSRTGFELLSGDDENLRTVMVINDDMRISATCKYPENCSCLIFFHFER